jgi:Zn-dependent protease with chaperone function/pimeloyl-ACP methyl ester carboxylesterase
MVTAARSLRTGCLVLLLGLAGGRTWAAEAADLGPAERARIDRRAAEQPLETPKQEQVNFAGNITAWLISQGTLTPEEERDYAQEWHTRLLAAPQSVPVPDEVAKMFRKLVEQLPPHLKPEPFRCTLTVLDVPEHTAFTVGAGLVYVTRPLLDDLLRDEERGPAALAFVVAHELGHVARGHTRRGWQLVQLEAEINTGVRLLVEKEKVRKLLQTCVATSGKLVKFLYTREQAYEADSFAWQLCRNAGVDADHALDWLRRLAAERHPRALDNGRPPDARRPTSTLGYYLSEEPDPLRRLRRLQMERDGRVDDEEQYGLFAYGREAGGLKRCGAGDVGAGEKAIVFVHGLRGDEETFATCLRHFAGRKELDAYRLLVFRHPNNDSLARGGEFLAREMTRVVASPENAFFVCHSAGGLVFRYYAEIKQGDFDRAVFLGTPHQGSSLTSLKFLVEAAEFVGELRHGLSGAVAATVAEGRGEVAHDLHPDSLFLQYLGRDERRAGRYHVFYGRHLGKSPSLALWATVTAARGAFRHLIAECVGSHSLRRQALRLLERLCVPDEVTYGDLIVSVDSASLEGAASVTATKLHHLALTTDKDVMRRVLGIIAGE